MCSAGRQPWALAPMNHSIQRKLLLMCSALVLLTAFGISTTYYVLTKQDTQREFRERIQVAFDFILDGIDERVNLSAQRVEDFTRKDVEMGGNLFFYEQEVDSEPRRAIAVYLFKVTQKMQEFGRIAAPDQLMIYDLDQRLVALYYRQDGEDMVGGYVPDADGAFTYLPMESSLQGKLLGDAFVIPQAPLPRDVAAQYDGEFPDEMSTDIIQAGGRLGIRTFAPVYNYDSMVGFLLFDKFFDQAFVERFAGLSQTAINLFAGDGLSVGTLPSQDRVTLAGSDACEAIQSVNEDIAVSSIQIGEDMYYQGQCAFHNARGPVGALTISLNRHIERQAIRKIVSAVLLVSGIALCAAFALSALFSRRSVLSLRRSADVITAVAEGDLRQRAIAEGTDEIGRVAAKLNLMIEQLRAISTQVQQASSNVHATADSIFSEMHDLITRMQEETALVDDTSEATQNVKAFIDTVARNTADLLTAADQILASIQETRASIHEVTSSTSALTENLLSISGSMDQVNQSMRQISDNTGQLEGVVQQTEQEIRQIDQALTDVSHNAERTQELARETMEAATAGHSSVDDSIQGMQELKAVVADSAQIIREVNSWSEQVSSILNIVDDVTEQTSLLSLNASIISAQAGVYGRGFAVVADEIKELATRTKASTKEIGTLVRELQNKTEEGVVNTEDGLQKADQAVRLASAVKDALTSIVESATRSSKRAADTAALIQHTTASGQSIHAQMNDVTQMVSNIRTALQEEETDIDAVVSAVENISGMAEQVNRASIEQHRAADDVNRSMAAIAQRFGDISDQTGTLQQNVDQIVEAMQSIEATTEHILSSTTQISGESIRHLIQQSELLQKSVHMFKVS